MKDDNGHRFWFKAMHPHRKRGDFKKVKVGTENCLRCGLKWKYRKRVECPSRRAA